MKPQHSITAKLATLDVGDTLIFPDPKYTLANAIGVTARRSKKLKGRRFTTRRLRGIDEAWRVQLMLSVTRVS